MAAQINHGVMPCQDDCRCLSTARYPTRTPKVDPYSSKPTNYVQLLKHIHKAKHLPQLEELLDEFHDKFDAVHTSAAISKLPKVLDAPAGKAKDRPAELLDRLQVSFGEVPAE
eukprot:jgi/Chrzof1/9831/Cz04g17210.t1